MKDLRKFSESNVENSVEYLIGSVLHSYLEAVRFSFMIVAILNGAF